MTKVPVALLFAAALIACAEPRPSGTGGHTSGTGTTAGTTGGSGGSTGGGTGGATTGGSGGTTGGSCGSCPSGSCLGGHCCTAACNLNDPTGTCKPTTCGTDGACAYPGSVVPCGGGCDARNQFTAAGSCNGAGSCSSTTQDCGEFACLPTGCPTFCSDDSVCVGGAHCFLPQRTCCPAIASGATLYVDSSIGADKACCGSAPGLPCQTLTAAMHEIEISHATGVTINATVNGSTGDWTAPESWPVALHLGVTLHAPGVFFFIPDALQTNLDVFDVQPFDANDRLPVIIEGDVQFYALIGFDSNAAQYGNTRSAVSVTGMTLKLGSVWLNGSNAGAEVGDNGTLEIDGFVQIGYYQNVSATSTIVGYDGIVCGGSSAASPSLVIDPGASDRNLSIQGQSNADLHAYSFCTVSLQHTALFGFDAANANGVCPTVKPDYDGVLAEGDPLSITLNSPLIQCMDNQGVQLYSGNPVVTLNDAYIAHCGCAAMSTFAGTLYANHVAVGASHWGALQEDGKIVLSGGANGGSKGGSVIGCNSEFEPGLCYKDGYPGVDLENDSANPMDADNTLLDHAPPSEIQCVDYQYSACVCISGTACSPPSDFDGVDVALIDNTGGISLQNIGSNGLGCR